MPTPLKIHPDADATIEGVGRALRAGQTTCAAVLERCFHRVDFWDDRVHAWVYLDRSGAMRRARELDAELDAGRDLGPLHGIPFGVKDIIDVAGMPTAAGFAPWRDRVAENDAALVERVRAAGAVILGKTATTQFAWVDPPVTCNPWNLDRTPGGSSSGSAAAVATGMCLAALGTQTGGSVIRPAAYCGVVGYKPVFEGFPSEGIVPFAPSLDHPGLLVRTCADLYLADGALQIYPQIEHEFPEIPDAPGGNGSATPLAPAEPQNGPIPASPPRLLRLRGFYDRRADAVMREATDRAVASFASAGARIDEVVDEELGLDFDEVLWHHRVIMASEAAAGHEARLAEHGHDYAPRIRALVAEGLTIPASRYVRSQFVWREAKDWGAFWFERLGVKGLRPDAVVMPATLTPAPDRQTTGDPAFNSAWSFFGVPAVTIPVGLSPDGLPLGLQLVDLTVGRLALINTAAWCEDVVRRTSGKD